jgi:uncharacterized Zn ribbon protein
MCECHYCRDAATTTAGTRAVCDDCQATYQQVRSENDDRNTDCVDDLDRFCLRIGQRTVVDEPRGFAAATSQD